MHLNEIFFEKKNDFLKTVEAKDIIIARYFLTKKTMAINKCQRSRLTFDLSLEVSHIRFSSIF